MTLQGWWRQTDGWGVSVSWQTVDRQVHSDVNVQNIINGTLQTALYWSVTVCSIQPPLCLCFDPPFGGTTINNSLSPWCAVVRCTVVSERPAQSYCMPYRDRAVAPYTLQAQYSLLYYRAAVLPARKTVRTVFETVDTLCTRFTQLWVFIL